MSNEKEIKETIWLGDSLDVIRSFDKEIKQDIGWAIDRLQNGQDAGESVRDLKGLPKKVWEIRLQDKAFWYRVAFVTFVKGKIVVVHAFKKKSSKTSSTDLKNIRDRLKEITDE